MKRLTMLLVLLSMKKAKLWCNAGEEIIPVGLSKTFWDYAILVGLAALFALNFPMTKVAVAALEPWVVVAVRLGIAAVVLSALMFYAGLNFPSWGKIWWPLILSAFFGHTLPFSLLSWGQGQIDAGLTAMLMATMPLFTLLLAQLFTDDEKPTRYSVTGFAVALGGIILLFGPDKLASLTNQSLGQYAAMTAAMSYGVNAIVTKSLVGLAWQQSSAAFMCLAFVMSLPMMVLVDFTNISTDLTVWSAVLYSGLIATAFAAVIILVIIRRTSASFLSQINFLVPVFGVLFSILLLGEVLPPDALIALFIILLGVAIARRRPKRAIISINKGG